LSVAVLQLLSSSSRDVTAPLCISSACHSAVTVAGIAGAAWRSVHSGVSIAHKKWGGGYFGANINVGSKDWRYMLAAVLL